MRLGYRVAYRGIRAWTFVRRPSVRGTMVAVLDDAGRVLLVRHTYGDRRRWSLPGGWVHAGEELSGAARREVLEELGVDVVLEGRSGVLHGDWDFKREALAWFAAPWPGGNGTYDPVEIAEVAWFPLDRLPPHVGGAARAVLSQL
jgi:ADP-ribose pyrophosphatase YjhB (NUDIX family)